METVKAYYDGHAFVPLLPVSAAKNRAAIVMILDNAAERLPEPTYVQYAGALSDDNYEEIVSILQDTRKIDENDWLSD